MRKPRSSNKVSGIQRFSVMGDLNSRKVKIRHARPCAGHPRLTSICARKDVDGRVEPGHDEVREWWRLRPLPAQVLADHDALGPERLAQHRDTGFGLGLAAHEYVERRV